MCGNSSFDHVKMVLVLYFHDEHRNPVAAFAVTELDLAIYYLKHSVVESDAVQIDTAFASLSIGLRSATAEKLSDWAMEDWRSPLNA
jgi:hypothetical protein